MTIKSKQKGNWIYHKSEAGGIIKHPKDVWCPSCDEWAGINDWDY